MFHADPKSADGLMRMTVVERYPYPVMAVEQCWLVALTKGFAVKESGGCLLVLLQSNLRALFLLGIGAEG